MSLTKADIDALWDAHRKRISGSVAMNREDTYLAAGLTATGERKPERVRMWRGKSQWTGNFVWFEREPKPGEFLMTDLTPGWFVPDGAE